MIPQAFIDELLHRVDVVELVGRYVKLKRGGANFVGLCPFHQEKSPSFTVSPTKQFYHCFGCGAHGTALGFLMEYTGVSFPDAIRDLAQGVGMTVPQDADPEDAAERARSRARSAALHETLEKAAAFYKQQLRGTVRAIDYLKGRGLSGEVAARFGLGYAPDRWDGLRAAFADYAHDDLVAGGLVILKDDASDGEQRRYDRFRDRIMFPIRNPRGEVIAFGGRVIDRGEPKYLNSPETPVFQKGSELYGLFEARQAIRERGYVLVVEGYMDVVALAQLGCPNAVATLGTACTPAHVMKLLRQTDRVVFSFDGDAAGRRAAWRALEASLPHAADDKMLSFLFLPPEHDPDSYIRAHGADAFEREVAGAMPLSRYFVDGLAASCNLSSAEGRAKLVHDAAPLLKTLPEGMLRVQVVDALAEIAHASSDVIARAAGLSGLGASTRRDPRSSRAAPARAARAPVTPLIERIARLLNAMPAAFFALDDAGRALLARTDEPLRGLATTLARLGPDAATPAALHAQAQADEPADHGAPTTREPDGRGTPQALSLDEVLAELRPALRALEIDMINAEVGQLLAQPALDATDQARYQALNARRAELKRGDTSADAK